MFTLGDGPVHTFLDAACLFLAGMHVTTVVPEALAIFEDAEDSRSED